MMKLLFFFLLLLTTLNPARSALRGADVAKQRFDVRRSRIGHNGSRRATTNWYTQYWADLPDNIRDAARDLGYDQASWDNGETIPTDYLYWHQLTPAQQAAAVLVFGYDEDTWNDYVARLWESVQRTPASTPVSTPISTPKETEKPVDNGELPVDNDVGNPGGE